MLRDGLERTVKGLLKEKEVEGKCLIISEIKLKQLTEEGTRPIIMEEKTRDSNTSLTMIKMFVRKTFKKLGFYYKNLHIPQ